MVLVNDLKLEPELWSTFSALLDGPATAHGLSLRLNRPIAIVNKYLSYLVQKGVVIESSRMHFGGVVERSYYLPDKAIQVNDTDGLVLALSEVRKGVEIARNTQAPLLASMVSISTTREQAQEILQSLRKLRDDTEQINNPGDEVRFTMFIASWTEET